MNHDLQEFVIIERASLTSTWTQKTLYAASGILWSCWSGPGCITSQNSKEFNTAVRDVERPGLGEEWNGAGE